MTAEEHIIAWIESSKPHYDRLLRLARGEALTVAASWPAPHPAIARSRWALELVHWAYKEMVAGGDAYDTYTSTELLNAAGQLLTWEEPA